MGGNILPAGVRGVGRRRGPPAVVAPTAPSGKPPWCVGAVQQTAPPAVRRFPAGLTFAGVAVECAAFVWSDCVRGLRKEWVVAKKLKVGVIGTGGISRVHFRGYIHSRAAKIYALADVDAAALARRADEYDVPAERCFTDYRKLLKLDELDAVSICTPNLLHARQSIDALRAGKHVLCEKPMAMNPREAQRMVDAAKATGKKLQIGLHQRFRNDAAFVKRLIEQGRLGKIYYARCRAVRRRGVPSWGVFGQLDKQGGGGLIDIGVHQIDLTWWLMGCPRPVSVSGQAYQTIGPEPGHVGQFGPWDHGTYTVEDFACGLVRFDNGATMSIECSFNVNLDGNHEGCHLVGDRGGAGLGPLSVQLEINGHLTDCTPHNVDDVDGGTPRARLGAHDKEVVAFCRSIQKDRPVLVPAAEAIWTQKIIDGIYRSAKSGKEVAIR